MVMWLILLAAVLGPEDSFKKIILEHQELDESSGVCANADGTVIWTHNDSGDEPRLFAFSREGKFLCELLVTNAKAQDWEDICSFQRDGKEYLAVADVGDNNEKRERVEIYVIEMPGRHQLKEFAQIKTKFAGRLRVTYEDGSHNCEAIAYDPVQKSFLLATKEKLQSRFYQVDASVIGGKEDVVAKLVQSIVLPLVTGCDISADGQFLVLSTYGAGLLLGRSQEQSGNRVNWQPRGSYENALLALPLRKQGESVCFVDQGSRLLLTSEFLPAPLYELSVPSKATNP